jgi:lactate dehydrogenase-like 2-hydroxyacid dehydrogenase
LGLGGKVLGLIGFGRIGQATARLALGHGMTIRYHSRRAVPTSTDEELAARWVPSIDELLAVADVVSLHCPGGPLTHHLIDARALSIMKPTAILINTARGTVVDEAALADALAQGRLYGAGLDVYEREPAVEPALLTSDRAVLLPHIGSATLEAREAMGMRALDNLDAFFEGRPVPDRVV